MTLLKISIRKIEAYFEFDVNLYSQLRNIQLGFNFNLILYSILPVFKFQKFTYILKIL